PRINIRANGSPGISPQVRGPPGPGVSASRTARSNFEQPSCRPEKAANLSQSSTRWLIYAADMGRERERERDAGVERGGPVERSGGLRRVAPLRTAAAIGTLVTLAAPAARAKVEPTLQLSAEFPIDLANPEASVPDVAKRNAKPLEFGYYLQDLIALGDDAMKRGDHGAAAHFFSAFAMAVPDRSVAFSKLCEAL